MISNPLRPIYDLANEYTSKRTFPDNPLYMDVELTNLCNMDCIFCQRQQMDRLLGYMSMEDFTELVKQSQEAGVKALRFVGWGESFLHKSIMEMLKMVKDAGMMTHITTNALLIKDDTIDKLCEVGEANLLDSVIFSMQGLTEEEYFKQRNSKKFHVLKSNILKLVNLRNERNLTRPFIQIMTSTTNETDEEIEKFKEEWGQIVDLVTVGRTWLKRLKGEAKDRVKDLIERSDELARPTVCNEVRYKFSIHWNGNVSACCEDYDDHLKLGNIREQSLKEIWDARHSHALRTLLNNGHQGKFDLCSNCELTQPYRVEDFLDWKDDISDVEVKEMMAFIEESDIRTVNFDPE